MAQRNKLNGVAVMPYIQFSSGKSVDGRQSNLWPYNSQPRRIL